MSETYGLAKDDQGHIRFFFRSSTDKIKTEKIT